MIHRSLFYFGVEIETGGFVPIIAKDAVLPVKNEKMFTTIGDYQHSIIISITQKNILNGTNSEILGQLLLSGINNCKKGEAKIQVVFSLGIDGLINVSVKDLYTKNQENFVVGQRINLLDKEFYKHNNKTEVISSVKYSLEYMLKKIKFYKNELNEYDNKHFLEEIKEIENHTKKAIDSVSFQKMLDCKMVLHTIIGELEYSMINMEVNCEGIGKI